MPHRGDAVSFKQLSAFFLPLGVSATLVTVSHVIINSTLARASSPETVIASYAIALSLLGITERPAILIRQTCSALVRDRLSFRAMASIAFYVFACLLIFGALVSYTPLGKWIFLGIFGVNPSLLDPIVHVYRIMMFVSLFSGIRCLYQGIIIFNMRTKWLTIGMVIRLLVMACISYYYIAVGGIDSGNAGAVIFLAGMMVESLVSFLEGRLLLQKEIPLKKAGHAIERRRQVFEFLRPLLLSSFLAVLSGPAINAMLGKTSQIELAIASYAIAFSLMNLVLSFFSYIHQIVLNFYLRDQKAVARFALFAGFIPTFLIAALAYSPVGPWLMTHIMGVNERLMAASIHTLRVFMLTTLVFPWLDFCNGLLMLKGDTKVMLWSQSANLLVTLITLFILVSLSPGWNGMIGALAQSLGTAAELSVVAYVLLSAARSAQKPLSPSL